MAGIQTAVLGSYYLSSPVKNEAPDKLEVKQTRFQNTSYIEITIDPAQFNFQVIKPNEEQSSYSAEVVINGGYFEQNNSPSGLLVSDSLQISPPTQKPVLSGLFLVKNGKASIVWARDYQTDSRPEFAVQNGPLVIEPGGKRGIRKKDGLPYKRTLIAVDKTGKVHIIIIKTPASLYQCQELLLKKIKNIDAAVNLDGGPSTYIKYRSMDFGNSQTLPYLIRIIPKNRK